MSENKKELTKALNIQLELFQSTNRLNLSETYEAIPKEVSRNDPLIEWITDDIAKPVSKTFSVDGISYSSEISPANITNKKTGEYKSHFPDFREARVEYALISLSSKEDINIDTDDQNNKRFFLKTTYYQIQKEIVDAINKRENRELKPNDCPYNTTSIKEALEILKRSDISVHDSDGNKNYIFTRVKDILLEDKKVVIELGNMITGYISSGEWRATDSNSILASKGKYEMKLRVLLQLRFTYATEQASYDPSLNTIIQEIDFIENKEKRITLQKIVKLLEKLHEVERVEVEKQYQSRKLVNARLHIFPSMEFRKTMIENNKANKRVKEPLKLDDGTILVEPMRSDFEADSEFRKAKTKYDTEKGKSLFKKR